MLLTILKTCALQWLKLIETDPVNIMEAIVGSKAFEDEQGKIWIVTKTGSTLEVKGRREIKEKLNKIARSCASKLGVNKTSTGIPLQYVNEHRRIWNAIWEKGHSA